MDSIWQVQLSELNYDQRESAATQRVLEAGWLTMGQESAKFEGKFAEMLSDEPLECVAVSSCTAALHLSLIGMGIGPGDDVIVPALTFVAAANVVRQVGANPIFADCTSIEDWNLSLSSIERCVTENTKAVMVVHFAGFPCVDIEEIVAFCRERSIFLIEDVAHAPGASIGGKRCGVFGDVGCFSFFSNKNLAVGEGGMISARPGPLVDALRRMRSHGMTSATLDRHNGRGSSYDVAEVGLNYRMDEIRAAIGIAQLEKLEAGNLRRKVLSEKYDRELPRSLVEVPFRGEGQSQSVSSYHIYPVLLPEQCDRPALMEYLKSQGVQSSIHYPSFSDLTAHRDGFGLDRAKMARAICSRELTLPLFPTMSEGQVEYVVNSMKQFFSLA